MKTPQFVARLEEKLECIATDVTVLKAAIKGNGTIGLADRMTTMEAWVRTHPRECPLVGPSRMNRWAVFGIIGGLVIATSSLVVAIVMAVRHG